MERDVFKFLNGLSENEVVDTSTTVVSYNLNQEEILKILNGLNEYDAANQLETPSNYTYDMWVIKLYNRFKFYHYNVVGDYIIDLSHIAICSNRTLCSNRTICGNYTTLFGIIIELRERKEWQMSFAI